MDSNRLKYLDRTCLIILVALALGGILWTAGTFIRQERRLEQEKKQQSLDLAKLAQTERDRKALQLALTQVQQELASLNRRIPPEADMGALLQQLNLRMKERRITMATIQPQAAVTEGLMSKLPIRLVFQGTFAQVYHFLRDLETMDRLLIPEKMAITGLEPPRECQVDLTVMVFERKTAKGGGG